MIYHKILYKTLRPFHTLTYDGKWGSISVMNTVIVCLYFKFVQ